MSYLSEIHKYKNNIAGTVGEIGILSLKHEIAWAKENGYNYLYMGLDDRYKRNFDGYEQCPPA